MEICDEIKNKQDQGEIYLITCIINNKKYIGQAYSYQKNGLKHGALKRFKNHISQSKGKNWNKKCRALYSAMRKYGEEKFTVKILKIVRKNKMDDCEKQFIKQYNTLCPNGYNLTEGGSNGRRCEDTCKKISEGLKGHKISDKTRKKISESLQGSKHPNWGKKHKPETLKRMSEKQKGEKHPMYGKTHTMESRKKISNSGRKYNINDNLPMYLVRYNSKKDSGYRVSYYVNNKKKEKTFTHKALTLQEKLEKALEFHRKIYSV
ncbi:MAG: hypothetical protein GTN36_05700 [Candidatus Aenigmarchaeota archaeon]|nr:hypothetical protein [Candidatus Aenigmarchaeota archaeon]